MTTFSLHAVKHITTGEGGVVATNCSELANRLRRFRNHGITRDHHQRQKDGTWFYDMEEMGFNYRLTELNSVLGISQLQKLPMLLDRRREIALRYNEAFSALPQLSTPIEQVDSRSAWHLYVIRLNLDYLAKDRNEIFNSLRAENIGVNVHYIPVPWLTYYQKLGYQKESWPIAESNYQRMISLPIWPGMTNADVEDVILAVNKVLTAYRK
jgi:dTDP-4-amino-4,6-dideoxygalactose transaminase